MAEKNSFTIDEDLLEAAGAMLPGRKSPISLFQRKGGQVPGDAAARIRAAGILDASGSNKAGIPSCVRYAGTVPGFCPP